MSYTIRPNVGDTLANTRDPIRTNFEVIRDRFNDNHVGINSGAGGGKHKFLQMPEQGSNPTTAVNEGALYVRVGVNPAESNLLFRAENSGGGGGFVYQLTRTIAASTGTFGKNNSAYVANHDGGWTFLPGVTASGGLILQFGRRSSAPLTGTITFPIVFPSGSAPFSAVINIEGTTTREYRITALSSNQISYAISGIGGTFTLNWYAIGN